MFVCYDIKGIQNFIFSVPRLKSIVGASSQIAKFDDITVKDAIAKRSGRQHIFSGGGRGAIECIASELDKVKNELVTEAHRLGLDIRIGYDEQFSQAALYADKLFPFVPGRLDGPPCAESGLWPVPGSTGQEVHPLILDRIKEGQRDDHLETKSYRILEHSGAPLKPLLDAGLKYEFLRNVNPDEKQIEGEDAVERHRWQPRAHAGQRSLGSRNRWAIVVMDTNDMGRQLDMLIKGDDGGELSEKLRIVSKKIKHVTETAFGSALGNQLRRWLEKIEPDFKQCAYEDDHDGHRYVVLPFRPLILGGDDLVMICHSELAMDFVRDMSKEFTRLSKTAADDVQKDHGFNPWPGTDGRLTISAGVLFTKVTLPLHTAIPYAESLLGSAKGEYRRTDKVGPPAPAAVDWETITDTMVDTPAARRNRELRFIDREIDASVRLTRRPYVLCVDDSDPGKELRKRSLEHLDRRIKQLQGFPISFRSELKDALRKPWSGRMQFRLSISKVAQYKKLGDDLREPLDGKAAAGDAWMVLPAGATSGLDSEGGKQVRMSDVIDAISLLDEKHRLSQETAR